MGPRQLLNRNCIHGFTVEQSAKGNENNWFVDCIIDSPAGIVSTHAQCQEKILGAEWVNPAIAIVRILA